MASNAENVSIWWRHHDWGWPTLLTHIASLGLDALSITMGRNTWKDVFQRLPTSDTMAETKFSYLFFQSPSTRLRGLAGALRWRHNGHNGVSNHQPRHCLLSRLFGCRSQETSKLRVTGLCAGNSPGTGEFPAQMASNAENVSIWWRHHDWGWPTLLTHIASLGLDALSITMGRNTWKDVFQRLPTSDTMAETKFSYLFFQCIWYRYRKQIDQ